MRVTFSTNATSAASGAAAVSCAATAATYDFATSMRQLRSHAAVGSPPLHAAIDSVRRTAKPLFRREIMIVSPALRVAHLARAS
jgi:hypothetical protein